MDTSLGYDQTSWQQERPLLHCRHDPQSRRTQVQNTRVLLRYPDSILSKFTDCRAILCKGLYYPPVQPKPVMNTLQLHLPLCDATTDKSGLEVGHTNCCLTFS